jgi:hypothetical protein
MEIFCGVMHHQKTNALVCSLRLMQGFQLIVAPVYGGALRCALAAGKQCGSKYPWPNFHESLLPSSGSNL